MSGTMAWFMLAMVLYPDAQKKAQEEIDAVVGRGRLPSFDDLDKLVYIRAMVKETLRWHPVGPLGEPRDEKGLGEAMLMHHLSAVQACSTAQTRYGSRSLLDFPPSC